HHACFTPSRAAIVGRELRILKGPVHYQPTARGRFGSSNDFTVFRAPFRASQRAPVSQRRALESRVRHEIFISLSRRHPESDATQNQNAAIDYFLHIDPSRE